jgi:hypothetical protein
MMMSEHGPESAHRFRADIDTQLRQVAFDERSNEIPPPLVARSIVACEKGAREAAAQPELRYISAGNFRQRQPRQLVERDASC